MSYVIINDTHLGLKRKTGVTKASLESYFQSQLGVLDTLMKKHAKDEVIILGDLFDGGQVPYLILDRIHQILSEHQGKLVLVAGNHDLDKNYEAMSAFDFLCSLLPEATGVKGALDLEAGCRVISHLPNQRLFDQAIID